MSEQFSFHLMISILIFKKLIKLSHMLEKLDFNLIIQISILKILSMLNRLFFLLTFSIFKKAQFSNSNIKSSIYIRQDFNTEASTHVRQVLFLFDNLIFNQEINQFYIRKVQFDNFNFNSHETDSSLCLC